MKPLTLAAAIASASLAWAAQAVEPEGVAAQAGRFSFGVVGDAPYGLREELELRAVLAETDAEQLAFVIHLGDLKDGSSPCTDALLAARRDLLGKSAHPMIFVPGDNDWTDCHRSGFDPEERLAHLRGLFFALPESLGARRIAVETQAAEPRFAPYAENRRWVEGNVMFVALNVPGSNNNLGRSAVSDAEHYRRVPANRAWIRESFRKASLEGRAGVVIAMHADPLFELSPGDPRRAGYEALVTLLAQQAIAFRRPVLLLHGDTHRFRSDQPLADPVTGRAIANFRRVETFGSPLTDWVRITVEPSAPELFVVHTRAR